MSRTKAAETIRPAMEARLRLAGMGPTLAPIPELDMSIADPKRRNKAWAKAVRNVEHANAAAVASALDAARAPWFGCNAGRALVAMPITARRAITDLDVPALWNAIQRVRAVYARYLHAIGAPDPNPRGMDLGLMPEEFGSDGVEVDGGWDCRTEEERVKDATRAMMHIEGVLGRAGEGVLAEVKAVVLRDQRPRRVDRLIIGLAAVAKEA